MTAKRHFWCVGTLAWAASVTGNSNRATLQAAYRQGWNYAVDWFTGTPAPFPNALISNWIALAPKYKYGATLDLGMAFHGNPRPGHYAVRVTLTPGGPSSQSVYNDLLHYPNELANLPYPGWTGKAVSNWVSITIIPRK